MTGYVCTYSICIANGDYYEAAKWKYEIKGAHLATLAELKALKNGGEISSGEYWSYTEHNAGTAYGFSTGNNYVANAYKSTATRKVLCVGN